MGTFGPARAVYTSLYLLSAPIAFGPFSKCLCFKKMTPFGNEKNSVFSKFFGPIAPARPEENTGKWAPPHEQCFGPIK